jgi:hypothetical protein
MAGRAAKGVARYQHHGAVAPPSVAGRRARPWPCRTALHQSAGRAEGQALNPALLVVFVARDDCSAAHAPGRLVVQREGGKVGHFRPRVSRCAAASARRSFWIRSARGATVAITASACRTEVSKRRSSRATKRDFKRTKDGGKGPDRPKADYRGFRGMKVTSEVRNWRQYFRRQLLVQLSLRQQGQRSGAGVLACRAFTSINTAV